MKKTKYAYLTGDVVSVLARVYMDTKQDAQLADSGLIVKVIGPHYDGSTTFAKLENVRMHEPVLEPGTVVSLGRTDAEVIATADGMAWVKMLAVNGYTGKPEYQTVPISGLARKIEAEPEPTAILQTVSTVHVPQTPPEAPMVHGADLSKDETQF